MGRAKNRRAKPRDAAPRPAETPSPARPPARLEHTAWLVAAALTIVCFGFTMVQAVDLWWHLAAGRWMWEHRSLPLTDPWSYTHAGARWIHHEWLADVVYHGWVSTFGLRSLVYWKWGLLVATFLPVFATLRRLTGHPLGSYAATTWAAWVGAHFFDLRPSLYSLLGYALLLWMRLPEPRAGLSSQLALPAVFLLWANLHSGFVFGLMALTVILAARAASRDAPFEWKTAAACGLACLANPNGLHAFTYPFRYALGGSPFRTMAEWLPPFVPIGGVDRSPLYPIAIALVILAALFLFARRFHETHRAAAPAAVGLVILTLAMSLRSRRFIPLFGISQALVLAPAMALALALVERRLARFRRALSLGLPAAAAVVAVVILSRYPLSTRAFHYLAVAGSFPVDTVSFIEANRLKGRVFAYYEWAGYLLWRVGDRLKVYIDPRADTVYGGDTYERYLAVQRQGSGWMETLEAAGADYVLWNREEAAVPEALVKSGRWRLVHEDYVSLFLARTNVALSEPVRPPPDSPYRSLALADQAMRQNRAEEAGSHLKRALTLMPELDSACYTLAGLEAAQGALNQARRRFESCQDLFPNPEAQHWFRGISGAEP